MTFNHPKRVSFLKNPSITNEVVLLKLNNVLARFPVSRSGWYQGIKDGIYPPPIKIGLRATAWLSSDIDELISSYSKKGGGQ